MTIAEKILSLIERKRRLSLTAEDIADFLFGQDNAYPQRVEKPLQQLVEKKKLVIRGKGGQESPYTYHLPFNKRV